jgi:uncharacterized membrane protein HdeD (DUF308 family)
MNTSQGTMVCPPLAGTEEIQRSWKWFLGLGILSIILGVVALGAVTFTTFAFMFFLGFLLMANGVVQAIQAFKAHAGKEFFLHLLAGVLYAVVGLLIVAHPAAGAASLTLLLASFFMVGGVFRMIGAIALRFPNWGWVVLNGIVTFLMGVAVWAEWPVSGLWVIGLFIGVEMIINGWSGVMFALAAKKSSCAVS